MTRVMHIFKRADQGEFACGGQLADKGGMRGVGRGGSREGSSRNRSCCTVGGTTCQRSYPKFGRMARPQRHGGGGAGARCPAASRRWSRRACSRTRSATITRIKASLATDKVLTSLVSCPQLKKSLERQFGGDARRVERARFSPFPKFRSLARFDRGVTKDPPVTRFTYMSVMQKTSSSTEPLVARRQGQFCTFCARFPSVGGFEPDRLASSALLSRCAAPWPAEPLLFVRRVRVARRRDRRQLRSARRTCAVHRGRRRRVDLISRPPPPRSDRTRTS